MIPRVSIALAIALLPVRPLVAQGVHYEGAVSVSRGSYLFSVTTTSWSVLTGLAVDFGPVTLRGTIPVNIQNTTLLAAGMGTGIPTGGGGDATRALQDSVNARKGRGSGGGMMGGVTLSREDRMAPTGMDTVTVPQSAVIGYTSHIGDPTFQLAVSPRVGDRTLVGVSVTVKAPITDTTSFGTGAWDVGGDVSVSQQVGDRTFVGVNAGYWHLGDLPDLDLRDPWIAGATISQIVSPGWAVSLSGSAARSAIDTYPASVLVSGGVMHVGMRGSVGVTAGVGLSDTSPDFALGVTWRVGLGGG